MSRAGGRVGAGWRVLAPVAVLALAVVSGCHKQQAVNAAPNQSGAPAEGQSASQSSPPGPGASSGAGQQGSGASSGSASSVEALKVKNALMTSKQPLDARHIEVQSSEGMVHLVGTVPTAQQKALAERLAKQAVGGKAQVMNMLTVGKGGG